MPWVKTVEQRYINLDKFDELLAYNLDSEENENFLGIKLTARSCELMTEVVISYFEDIDKCCEFIFIMLNSPCMLNGFYHKDLYSLIGKHPDYPRCTTDFSDAEYKRVEEEREKFISRLNIQETECCLDND